MFRDTVLDINLDLWDENFSILKQEVGDVQILGVVKANAYGHGAAEMVKVMESRGLDSFAVATLNEALRLRASSSSSILIFGPTPPRLYPYVLQGNFVQSIGSYLEGEALLEEAIRLGKSAQVEIKIDTGLHRWGFPDDVKSREEILLLAEKGLHIRGIYSHLSLTNHEEDERQYYRFMEFTEKLRDKGLLVSRHLADSIAAIDRPSYRLDKVRLGSALYGMHSFKKPLPVLPIASLRTKIAKLVSLNPGEGVGYDYLWRASKPSRLATLPLGYVDGLSRSMSGKGYVLIKGQKAPLRGLMCMDSLSVDVTEIQGVKLGDDVLVFGPGLQGELTIEEIALLLSTNKNQLLSALSPRLPRRYTRKGKSWILDDLVGD